jgi:hypothetical protein
MTYDEPASVAVSRRIESGASEIFQILADPRRHTEIDGSGMLRGAITDSAVSRVGDVFAMKMYYEQFGDYEMNNHVVEYVLDRRITWEPELRDVEEPTWHHRWGFELRPDGAGVTVVTEIFNCCRAPEEGRKAVKNGTAWIDSMTATLERLDQVCAGEVVGSEPAANETS